MSIINVLPRSLPVLAREEILAALFETTAEAFKVPAPACELLAYDDSLREYALFTREQAEKALRSGQNLRTIKTRLYRSAYPLGAKLRELLNIDSMEEVMALGQILYQAIGVEIEGDAQGNLTVTRCYFSEFYSAPVCGLIGALDDGVFSGLSGGGRLTFSRRITENAKPGAPARCRARLSTREEGIQ